tara:strand:+ start:64 stop:393 length:330 start_codon:yes stop_codon:yes gene_type:complete
MASKYYRKSFEFGGGADTGRDRKVPKVPSVKFTFNKEKAKKILEKEKSKPVDPKEPKSEGVMKGTPLGMPSFVKGAIKAGKKYLKKNPQKFDKEKIAELTKKIKKLKKD